ncbi:hypothetical protein Ddye_002605 [Dipteronia dyeriana]|uniref:Fe2OG dioxygenase domain-containing protein n=1 Tax=Dipteronia dyeriana TaxID=168575 RepID=A0AAE0CUL1_9ROSI|nr:hypothetical protein Ddye_002605 [Dipteronia dyeriana]
MADSNIPAVDLSPFFREGDHEDGKKKAREVISQACSQYGFFQIQNHGVPLELLIRALELSKTFFEYSDDEKRKSSPGSGVQIPAGVEDVFSHLTKLGSLIENIINECLGLPPNFLKEFNHDRSWDLMSAKRYFPTTESENNGISEHEDGNCVTIVLQDQVGGLQVKKNGEWIPVTSAQDTLVVNLGDVIQVLSNNKFKSATHKVVRQQGKSRYSYAFFYNLQGDKWVEPLSKFTEEIGEVPKYRGFLYKDYQALRIRNKTHPPDKPEDVIHITMQSLPRLQKMPIINNGCSA